VGAIDAGRLGDLVGRVSPEQQWGIDEAADFWDLIPDDLRRRFDRVAARMRRQVLGNIARSLDALLGD